MPPPKSLKRINKVSVSKVLDILARNYPGKGAVELNDPFKVLFATIISQRNRDELTEVVTERFFTRHPDIESLSKANSKQIAKLIYPSGFYNQKAVKIVSTAKIVKEKFAGEVPKTINDLLTLPGVGRKTANCVLAFGYKIPAIVVDTHVFRITQRLGWLIARTPDEAEIKLTRIVPKKYWVDINRVIVQHGRSICKPIGPKCHICPILTYCPFGKRRVGTLSQKTNAAHLAVQSKL